jgi:hypothetical protein
MGRNTTTPLPQSLDRFSIGEIQDLSGVPDYYNAGSSKWLKSGTFTASSNLTETTKTNIANSSTGYSQIALLSTLDNSYSNAYPYTPTEIPRISSSSITCYPCATSTNSQQVLAVKSTGVQTVGTGLVTAYFADGTGATSIVVSNGTKFFHYGNTSGSAFGLYTSTDGTTWTSQAMTGLPTVSLNTNNVRVFMTGSSALRTAAGDGTSQVGAPSYSTWGVVWCGARFLFFASNGTNYVAATSTDGYTWTNATSAVLDNSSATQLQSVAFYRNGNNCFIKFGTTAVQRFTSDGGITWAGITTSANFDAINVGNSTTRLYRNTTDPAKLLMSCSSLTGNTCTITTDSGAYFNTDISLPSMNSSYSSVAWKGNTMLYAQASSTISLKISTNNGTTFTDVLLPAGTLSSTGMVYADANRFYFFPLSAGQVLISTDGITWTIVALPTTEGGFSSYYGTGIIAFDSNKVMIVDSQGYLALTTDGGVNWKVMNQSSTIGSGVYAGTLPVTPDGGGFAAAGVGNTGTSRKVFSNSSATAGGSFYKVSSAEITPVRANAASFVRVS